MTEKQMNLFKQMVEAIPEEALRRLANETTLEEFCDVVFFFVQKQVAANLEMLARWKNRVEEDRETALAELADRLRAVGGGPEDLYGMFREED